MTKNKCTWHELNHARYSYALSFYLAEQAALMNSLKALTDLYKTHEFQHPSVANSCSRMCAKFPFQSALRKLIQGITPTAVQAGRFTFEHMQSLQTKTAKLAMKRESLQESHQKVDRFLARPWHVRYGTSRLCVAPGRIPHNCGCAIRPNTSRIE